jgi:pilus assembly protein CpaE
VADNLGRLDPALFEGLTVRDPLGFHLVGPPSEIENRLAFTEPMFREFASFLVEKYEAIVIDGGRWISDEIVLAALQSSSSIFLTMTQEFPAIRNAQRYVGALRRLGFNQEQIRIVVNAYQKKPSTQLATLEQIKQTLNMPVFYGVPSSPAALAAINKGRPFVADRQAAAELDRAFRAFVDKATGGKQGVALAATA